MKFLFFFIWLVEAALDFESEVITESALKVDPEIVMTRKCIEKYPEEVSASYFYLKSMSKTKKQAFSKIIKQQKKVIEHLIKLKIIASESMLVNSHIRPKYLHQKRMWSFSFAFVLYGDLKELSLLEPSLKKLGAHKLLDETIIEFLDEKSVVMATFAKAKSELKQRLSTEAPNYAISDILNVEIEGVNLENSDTIEEQLEESNSDDQIQTKRIRLKNNIKGKSVTVNCEIRIVFEVKSKDKIKNDQSSDDSDNSSESSESSSSSSSIQAKEL